MKGQTINILYITGKYLHFSGKYFLRKILLRKLIGRIIGKYFLRKILLRKLTGPLRQILSQAKGELTRLLLAAGNIDYEDFR